MLKPDPLPQSHIGGESPQGRACACPGCPESGLYPAPKARNQLREYVWLCLDHIREFNRSWDYYAGMSSAEIEAEMRSDTTWQRPSWPLGSWRLHEQRMRQRAAAEQDFPFGRQGGGAGRSGSGAEGDGATAPLRAEDEALRELQLERSASFAEIKLRYRELAKIHHPDANGGDKQAEERLKKINHAYTILKASHGR